MEILKCLQVGCYLAGIPLTIIGSVQLAVCFVCKDSVINGNRKLLSGILPSIVGMAAVLAASVLIPKMQADIKKENVHLETALNSYTWYLDGHEVDPQTVDLDDFKKKYDDNSKKVILSKQDHGLLDVLTVISATLLIICVVNMTRKE